MESNMVVQIEIREMVTNISRLEDVKAYFKCVIEEVWGRSFLYQRFEYMT